MKDLTTGSIPRHIASMSIQMAIGILVQTLNGGIYALSL